MDAQQAAQLHEEVSEIKYKVESKAECLLLELQPFLF